MEYKNFDEIKLYNFDAESIEEKYDNGYVLVRKEKGLMDLITSLRIKLEGFEFNSENRRIFKKTENLLLTTKEIPLKDDEYSYTIHMIGKDFYRRKNDSEVFSASKIKELITDGIKSNFNKLLVYKIEEQTIGYCISYETEHIFHYCYPFYDLNIENKNIGMGMIVKAIEYAKNTGKKYFYLGSVHTPKSLYKLQFNNLEWFDGSLWQTDLEKLKLNVTSSVN